MYKLLYSQQVPIPGGVKTVTKFELFIRNPSEDEYEWNLKLQEKVTKFLTYDKKFIDLQKL